MLEKKQTTEKHRFEGKIDGAIVALDYECQSGEQPQQVNAVATYEGNRTGQVNVNYNHAHRQFSIGVYSIDAASMAKAMPLMQGMFNEIAALYEEEENEDTTE